MGGIVKQILLRKQDNYILNVNTIHSWQLNMNVRSNINNKY